MLLFCAGLQKVQLSIYYEHSIFYISKRNPMPVSDAIKHTIRSQFGPEESDQVIRILEQYGTEAWHAQEELVHAGILELAKGDITSITGLVDEANRDYRNILYWLLFDEHGNPPPLPAIKADRTPKTPPDIPSQ